MVTLTPGFSCANAAPLSNAATAAAHITPTTFIAHRMAHPPRLETGFVSVSFVVPSPSARDKPEGEGTKRPEKAGSPCVSHRIGELRFRVRVDLDGPDHRADV